jgi:hypothetical protein
MALYMFMHRFQRLILKRHRAEPEYLSGRASSCALIALSAHLLLRGPG